MNIDARSHSNSWTNSENEMPTLIMSTMLQLPSGTSDCSLEKRS